MFVLYDFSCVVLCDFLIQVKAQRLFRYKKNIKISQKVIKKNHKSKYIKIHRLFQLSIMCLIFYDYFPFFLFCYWQILQLTGAKEHLMNYNTTICWQCELAPFFSLISRATLELLHLLFVYSFSLFQYISCVRVPCSFVWNIFLIWMIAHTKIMKIVAFSSKSWKLSQYRRSH